MIRQILNYIEENLIGIIAVLGLATSIIALTWNIIRDLVVDKTKLSIKVRFGGILVIRGTTKGEFFEKGSLPNKEIPDERILFTIVNSGRRPVMIEEVGAKYKLLPILKRKVEAKMMHIVSDKLPEMLKPYEILNIDTQKIKRINDDLKNGNIKYFFVKDTKNKYWRNPKKNIKKLLISLEKSNKL